MQEIGIHPWLACLGLVLAYVVLAMYLQLNKPMYASYIVMGFGLLTLLVADRKQRNEFISYIFNQTEARWIIFLEHCMKAFPFVLILLWYGSYGLAGLYILICLAVVVMPKVSVYRQFNPSPFPKHAFELNIGFRNAWVLYILQMYVLVQAIIVHNENLAIVSIAIYYLFACAYFVKMEPYFYIWNYNLTSKQFLFYKIRTACLGLAIIGLPLTIGIIILFPSQVIVIIALLIFSNIILATLILAKYSAYPNELGLPQVLLFSLCVWFPPLLLFVIPTFYKHAVRQLNTILL